MTDPGATERTSALLRRVAALTEVERTWLLNAVGRIDDSSAFSPAVRRARQRRGALEALRKVAEAAGLAAAAPTVEQFKKHAAAVAPGRTVSRIVRLFGRWSAATDAYREADRQFDDDQLARLSAARASGPREREEYVDDVRRFLDSHPLRTQTADYERWQKAWKPYRGERPPVTYSMLRKALPWPWETTKAIAAGSIATEDAATRQRRPTGPVRGRHDLVSLSEIERLFGLARTAARNLTRQRGFPPPAYTQRRPPGIRLWRRRDVEDYLSRTPTCHRRPNDLQGLYLDTAAVAEATGLAFNTVRGGGGAHLPPPEVSVAGLRLWLQTEVRASGV